MNNWQVTNIKIVKSIRSFFLQYHAIIIQYVGIYLLISKTNHKLIRDWADIQEINEIKTIYFQN